MRRIYFVVVVAMILALVSVPLTAAEAYSMNSSPPSPPTNLQMGVANISLEQLTTEADLILLGTVTGTRSYWNTEHTIIYTDAVVSVEDVVRGNQALQQVTVTQVGGRVGSLTLSVSESAIFRANERSILFLKANANGTYSTVGWKYGRRAIERDRVDAKTSVSTFVGQVRQVMSSRGIPLPPPRGSKVGGQDSVLPAQAPSGTDQQVVTSVALPVISSITPSSGSAGTNTQVTITGSNFGSTQSSSSVTFYYRSGQPRINASIVSWTDTGITVTVPVDIINDYAATASSGPVIVTTSAGNSNDYQFGVTFSYMGARWTSTNPHAHYRVNPNLSGVAGAENAVQSAAQTWSYAGSNFSFAYDGITGASAPGYNGANEIMWGNLGVGILAATWVWWDGFDNMREFDMEFNTYYTWSTTGAGEAFDIQSIATHELGHALGLRDLYGDVGTPNDMAKVMFGFGTYSLKRTLHPDDMSGVQWIYGPVAPAQAVIGYSPSSFTFTATQGGANPAGQTLNIQNTGGGTLGWSIVDDATWLTLSPASGSSTGETDAVTVSVIISGLNAGTYNATITISASGATNTPRTVPVTLVVNPPALPTIGYSPSGFTFTATQGGANPANQTLNIQNTGSGTLNWAVSDAAAWLTLSPSSGSSIGETDAVTVSVNITGMIAGSYSASITITAAGASNTPRTVPVSLTINAGTPSLGSGVDNTALSWTTGGNGNWFAETVTSYYGGSADQSGVISHSQSTWLRSTATGPGTLSFYWKVSSEANYDFLKFSIDGVVKAQISGSVGWQQKSYSISSGTHTLEWKYSKDASVNSGSDCGWLDKVEYTAAAPSSPVIGYSPSSFTFTATQGGANPAGQTLNIQNTGSGTLNWAVSDAATWLSLSPASGSSTGETDAVTVSVINSGLNAGTYNVTITISASGATNTPRTVPVTLVVNPPALPTIGYSPSGFTFTATQGGANPANQTLNIQNTGSGTLNWAVSDAAAWLTLSPSSGSSIGETDAVTVSVNITGMNAGSYNATITIAATGASNTPRTVPVSLTINAGTPSLGSAVDNTALSWTTGGNGNWFAETVTSYYGGSADQSGVISHSQSTWLRSTVTGPGTLSFYWKVSSEANYDFLKFSIDGVVKAQISGSVGWQQKSYSISSGTHTLEWKYSKDASVNSGSDCGWLDKVQFP